MTLGGHLTLHGQRASCRPDATSLSSALSASLWPYICCSYSWIVREVLRMAVKGGLPSMLGWMLVFIAMSFCGGVAAAIGGGIGFTTGLTSSLVFGLLVVVSALTFTLRGDA